MSEKNQLPKKEKSTFRAILMYVGMVLLLFALCAFLIRLVNFDFGADPANPNKPNIEQPYGQVCDIEYYMVVDGKVQEVYDGLWRETGHYPRSYTVGNGVLVDELKAIAYPSSTLDYEYYGWYMDEECTQAFTGITNTTSGDVTLYAKIMKSCWTKNY